MDHQKGADKDAPEICAAGAVHLVIHAATEAFDDISDDRQQIKTKEIRI